MVNADEGHLYVTHVRAKPAAVVNQNGVPAGKIRFRG